MTADQHATTRRRDDALRAALDAARRPDAVEALRTVITRPQLEALAPWVHIYTRNLMAEGAVEEAARFRVLETLVRDAARFGYPRPPLEQLGAQAGHLPAARSTDPVTARESGERTRGTPTARNHLGRLLVGFLMYERQGNALRDAQGVEGPDEIGAPYDRTLTSEEVAHRVGLAGSEFAKRCSDLMQLGYIRVAQDTNGHDRTRRGDSGRQRLVFELTDDGRALASRIRRTTGLA